VKIDRDLLRRLAGLRFGARGLATGKRAGDRRSRAKGQGIEFADFREYGVGDDLKLVDWNVYQRLGTVLVRLFHEDRNLRIRIVLDTSRSMEAKLDQAGTLAAGLALVGLAHRDSVELATAPWRAPVAGNDLQGLPAVLAWLEPIESGDAEPVRRSLLAQAAGVRSDRTVLVSDLLWDDDTLEGVLEALAASSEAPVVVQTLGDAEKSPDLDGPVTWIDAEDGSELAWDGTGDDAGRYQALLQTWLDEIARRCRARRITWIPVYTSDAIHRVFVDALARAGVVGSATA
jgi:uncharacterized protein (DUF58 family)